MCFFLQEIRFTFDSPTQHIISMKKSLLFFLFVFSSSLFSKSQNWTATPVAKRFIENKSQFDGKDKLSGSQILYGMDLSGTQAYFTKQGLTYRFDKREKKEGEREYKPEQKKYKKRKRIS